MWHILIRDNIHLDLGQVYRVLPLLDMFSPWYGVWRESFARAKVKLLAYRDVS
jgi:hypothetical protein